MYFPTPMGGPAASRCEDAGPGLTLLCIGLLHGHRWGQSHFWLAAAKKRPLCVARWLTSGREASLMVVGIASLALH